MKIDFPLIDDRARADVLAELYQALPGYAPDWSPSERTAGAALMRVFARYVEILGDGLDRVPERSFMAFLDMTGMSLLPAQGARVPLVFHTMPNSPVDVTLPANSQVAAPAQPLPPSPLLGVEKPAAEPEPIIFSTTQKISLLRGRLAALYSLQPGLDAYADHTPYLTEGFTLFDDWRPIEHAIYLGHDRLLALADAAMVRLLVNLGHAEPGGVQHGLEISWEYLSKDGWLPLTLNQEDDKTEGLAHDGVITLLKSCGPDAKEETIAGHTSYWLRGRLLTPLPPASSGGPAAAPLLDTIRLQVGFTKTGLQPEAASTDMMPLDTGNTFYPFGKQPELYTTFYLASGEVFQRRGARVTLDVEMADPGIGSSTPKLALTWEYHDGGNWRSLANFDFLDSTGNFTSSANASSSGKISFRCPPNWAESTVYGQSNYWLRARISQGDYGHPLRLTFNANNEAALEKSTLHPPAIAKLTLQYTYQTEPADLDHCLADNNFVFQDYSHACRWPRQTFAPFEAVADRHPALYVGFDQPLPVGLVSLYLHTPPQTAEDSAATETPAFVWEYFAANGWTELGVLDETIGFSRDGMLQFIGQPDAVPTPGPGGNLYRVRARLKQGARLQPAPVSGIWLNAVWATHQFPVIGEVLGQSDGNPGQIFHFRRQHIPVLEGETIEVREWIGRGSDWETVVQDVPEADLRFERDLATDTVKAVWVRWRERPHLFGSDANSRHYVIERARGWLRFGDGIRGRLLPAGAQLIASFGSGGGVAGNVPAGAVTELRAGVPYLQSFTNPVAAAGGATVEAVAGVQARGPQGLRHQNRAVSPRDFEWLARDASPAVALSRCLPITGPEGQGQHGWVTVVIVPYGEQAQPQPTPELLRRVREYLASRAPAGLARRLRVIGPLYAPVGVTADIVPRHPEEAAQVEARLLSRLNAFLNPLSGGSDGLGWSFGQPLYLSQVAALVEATTGVDYASRIGLNVEGQIFDEHVPVEANTLVAAGDHEIKLILGER